MGWEWYDWIGFRLGCVGSVGIELDWVRNSMTGLSIGWARIGISWVGSGWIEIGSDWVELGWVKYDWIGLGRG